MSAPTAADLAERQSALAAELAGLWRHIDLMLLDGRNTREVEAEWHAKLGEWERLARQEATDGAH